jgi:predicted transcriptional regulator
MMIRDKWWREFCGLSNEGKKEFSYVRRGLAGPTKASFLFFYVTKPVGELAGYAEFIERKVGDAESLWSEHGGESVLKSKEEYEKLIGLKQKVSFIRFKNLEVATKPVQLSNLLVYLDVKKLGRNGFYINKETADKLISLMA